jgi:beta-hydroxyacyl-ACP dehydratase FabZ
MKLPLLYNDIIKLLPHRYPFLFVDQISELEMGKRVVGWKNVTTNEYFFPGHFPNNPIMPGVIIIEAMAQVGGVLARYTLNEGDIEKEGDKTVYFMAIDKAKFRKPVIPGDRIRFEIETLRAGSRVWKMLGKAYVEDDLVAQAEFTATVA